MPRTLVNLRNDLVWIFFVGEVSERCSELTTEEVWSLAECLDPQLENEEALTARQLMLDPAHHEWVLEAPVFQGPNGRRIVPHVRKALQAMANRELQRRRLEEQTALAARASGGGLGARTPADLAPVRRLHTVSSIRPMAFERTEGESAGRRVDILGTDSRSGRMRLTQRQPINWHDVDAEDQLDGADCGGPTKSEGRETGKDEDEHEDMRCGARYYLCADGKKVVTTDTEGIVKRIPEAQHILRMMSKARWTALFGTGLRIELAHVRDVLQEAYMEHVMNGRCDEMWRSIDRLSRVRDLPVLKNDKKFELFLKGLWNWTTVRELSLLDFLASKTPWRVWAKDEYTPQATQYLIQALENALLALEIVFGVPSADIGKDLVGVLQSDSRMLGTNDAFNFHQVNHAFAMEFRNTRLTVLEKGKRDLPESRLYGEDAFVRRLAQRFTAVIPRIPDGIAKTVVVDNFIKITYPSIQWHLQGRQDDTKKRGHTSDDERESEEDRKDEKKKQKKQKNKQNKVSGGVTKPIVEQRGLPDPPVGGGSTGGAVGHNADGSNGNPEGETAKKETHKKPCLFRLAQLLKMTDTRDGQIFQCSRAQCLFYHPRRLSEYTMAEVKAAVQDKTVLGDSTTQRFEDAIAALPATVFKRN
jgi:hypothetical protein